MYRAGGSSQRHTEALTGKYRAGGSSQRHTEALTDETLGLTLLPYAAKRIPKLKKLLIRLIKRIIGMG
jgi:hypothetical protein